MKHMSMLTRLALRPIAVVGMSFTIFSCVCHAQSSNSTNARDRVEIQCGAHKVAIACGKAKPGDPPDERICVRNVLSFAGENGKFVASKQPKSFRQEFEVQKTPTSIDCRKGKDGTFYVAVTFVAGPLACGPCSTTDLFTEGGERLTVNSKNLDRVIREHGIRGNNPILIEEYGK